MFARERKTARREMEGKGRSAGGGDGQHASSALLNQQKIMSRLEKLDISFSDIDSEDDDDVCPLCCADLQIEDLNFFPCPCGYQLCLFCYNRLKNEFEPRCPACRTIYGDGEHKLDPKDLVKIGAELQKEHDQKKRQKERDRKYRREERQRRKHREEQQAMIQKQREDQRRQLNESRAREQARQAQEAHTRRQRLLTQQMH